MMTSTEKYPWIYQASIKDLYVEWEMAILAVKQGKEFDYSYLSLMADSRLKMRIDELTEILEEMRDHQRMVESSDLPPGTLLTWPAESLEYIAHIIVSLGNAATLQDKLEAINASLDDLSMIYYGSLAGSLALYPMNLDLLKRSLVPKEDIEYIREARNRIRLNGQKLSE